MERPKSPLICTVNNVFLLSLLLASMEIQEQNRDKPFDPTDYTTFLMMSTLATSAFGREYKMSDADFKGLNDASRLEI